MNKRILSLFFVFIMVAGIISPINVLADSGVLFSHMFDFNTLTRVTDSAGGSVTYSVKEGEGYNGADAFEIKMSNKSGYPYMTTLIPDDLDLTGLNKVSFYVKTEATSNKLELQLRDKSQYVAIVLLADTRSTGDIEEWRYVEVNVEDKTGMNFAQLDNFRWTFGQTIWPSKLYISGLCFHGVRPVGGGDKLDIEISSVKLNDEENPKTFASGENTVGITVMNMANTDVNGAVFIVALFEKQTGRLAAINASAGDLIAEQESSMSLAINIPEQAQDYTLKAYLWENSTSIAPLADTIINLQ